MDGWYGLPEGSARGNWPNFIVIGAGRCGTTSLHYYLGQHPDVFVSALKEPNYFAFDPDLEAVQGHGDPADGDLYPVRTEREYLDLFASRGDASVVGEVSPLYFYTSGTAERIHGAVPDARIIAVLRDPAERAYSGYMKYVRDGAESRSFEQAVEDELEGRTPSSRRGRWHYLRMGYYARCLAPYFERFPRDRIAVYFFEDLKRDTEGTLTEIFRFLEVDDLFEPDCSIRYNASGVPKSRLLHRLLRDTSIARWAKKRLLQPGRTRWLAPVLRLQTGNLEKPMLPPVMRDMLLELYREDVRELETMLDRDLGHWR